MSTDRRHSIIKKCAMNQTIAHFFSLYLNVSKLYTIHENTAHLYYYASHFWGY